MHPHHAHADAMSSSAGAVAASSSDGAAASSSSVGPAAATSSFEAAASSSSSAGAADDAPSSVAAAAASPLRYDAASVVSRLGWTHGYQDVLEQYGAAGVLDENFLSPDGQLIDEEGQVLKLTVAEQRAHKVRWQLLASVRAIEHKHDVLHRYESSPHNVYLLYVSMIMVPRSLQTLFGFRVLDLAFRKTLSTLP